MKHQNNLQFRDWASITMCTLFHSFSFALSIYGFNYLSAVYPHSADRNRAFGG